MQTKDGFRKNNKRSFESLIQEQWIDIKEYDKQELEDSIKNLESALDKNIQTYGYNHWKTAVILELLARMNLKLENYKKSIVLLENLLKIQKEIFPDNDYNTLKTLNCLSNILFLSDRLNDAEKFYLEELEMRNEIIQFEISRVSKGVGKSRSVQLNNYQPKDPDHVYFSVSCHQKMIPGKSYILEVWAHLRDQKNEIIERIKKENSDVLYTKTKGPASLKKGTIINIKIKIPDLVVDDPDDTILWVGDIGNGSFHIDVPSDTEIGDKKATVTFFVEGVLISKLHFILEVSNIQNDKKNIPIFEERIKNAFISYSSQDLDKVLTRLQGILKNHPRS